MYHSHSKIQSNGWEGEMLANRAAHSEPGVIEYNVHYFVICKH